MAPRNANSQPQQSIRPKAIDEPKRFISNNASKEQSPLRQTTGPLIKRPLFLLYVLSDCELSRTATLALTPSVGWSPDRTASAKLAIRIPVVTGVNLDGYDVIPDGLAGGA